MESLGVINEHSLHSVAALVLVGEGGFAKGAWGQMLHLCEAIGSVLECLLTLLAVCRLDQDGAVWLCAVVPC